MFIGLNILILGITFLLYRFDYISGGLWVLIWLAVFMIERGLFLHKEKEGLIPLAKSIWLEDELDEEEDE